MIQILIKIDYLYNQIYIHIQQMDIYTIRIQQTDMYIYYIDRERNVYTKEKVRQKINEVINSKD